MEDGGGANGGPARESDADSGDGRVNELVKSKKAYRLGPRYEH